MVTPRRFSETNDLANAKHHLNLLRSTIHDGLTNKSDCYLKVSLLQDLDAAEASLHKASL